jgi:hypothetical protein
MSGEDKQDKQYFQVTLDDAAKTRIIRRSEDGTIEDLTPADPPQETTKPARAKKSAPVEQANTSEEAAANVD